MDVVRSGSGMIRGNSKNLTQFFLWSVVFMMLPIDSMLRVNVQGQVVAPVRQLLSNDIARALLAIVFYLIANTNDATLLVLYVCFLKKLGLF